MASDAAGARLRVLELFSGIGGVAAALGERGRVVAALDLDRVGMGVYRANFRHPTAVRNLEAMTAEELAAFAADLWTMSPPCQPYTRRGRGGDLDDPRAASLRHLVPLLPAVRPPYLFLENVPGFAGSRAHAALREALDGAGYRVVETLLCPSDLGWPNRRRRFYLLAAHRAAAPLRPLPPLAANPLRRPLSRFVDPVHDADLDLAVPPDLPLRYERALHRVRASDPDAVTACFTSAYGRSPVRSGSYLVLEGGPSTRAAALPRLRRFHPREILALLGFSPTYHLPASLPLANAWRLTGNSLSLPAVRRILESIP